MRSNGQREDIFREECRRRWKESVKEDRRFCLEVGDDLGGGAVCLVRTRAFEGRNIGNANNTASAWREIGLSGLTTHLNPQTDTKSAQVISGRSCLNLPLKRVS